MKITDEAKNALKDVLAANEAQGLIAGIQETCCGQNPVFQMAVFDENDKPEDFNDIKVLIPEENKDAFEDLIIDVINGELVVLNAVCGCGSGEGGCCSSHEEEGCCGGHHEGGCCHH